jgi:6-phosphogluconolactonase (cycloisomerase 2 family)
VRRLLILAAGIFLIAPQIAQACSINWTGKAGDGYWTTAGNWDLNRIPNSNDSVCIGSGFVVNTVDGVNIGTILSLTLDGSLTLNDVSTILTDTTATSTIFNLTLNGPSTASVLTVNGTANFTGTLTISDGAVQGEGTATLEGTVNVLKGNSSITPYTITNQGKIVVSGSLQLTLGTVSFVNASTGLIDLQADGITVLGGATFNNLGSITKSMGTGTSTFALGGAFTNNAKIGAKSGILQLSTSFANNGAFSASAGATLQFANVVTLNAGTTFDGAGTMDINAGGVWDVEAPVTVGAANLVFEAGEATMIRGVSDLKIKSATVTWNSGAITGAGKLTVARQVRNMEILSRESHTLEENLDLFGTVTMYADLDLSAATVTIGPNAKFNVRGDYGIHGTGVINNGGIFQKVKSYGVSTLDYGGTFNIVAPKGARPAVMAKTGTIDFHVAGGGALGGIWTVGSGAMLKFSLGDYSLPDGFQITGSGTTLLTTATWSLASGTGVSVETYRFEFNGTADAGIIQGDNNLTVNSTIFGWTGGRMQGPGTTTIPAGVVLTIEKSKPPGNKPVVEGRTIENAGTTYVFNTSLLLGGGAVWHNQAETGAFKFEKDGSIGDNGGGATFNNDGTVEKLGGIDDSEIRFSGSFNNTAGAHVVASEGKLRLITSQGSSAGEFNVRSGGELGFYLGTWDIHELTTIIGNGTVALYGVTWNLKANLDVQCSTFRMVRGATIAGAFDLTLEKYATLEGLRTGGTIKIKGASVHVDYTLTLDACTLDNSGYLYMETVGTVVVQNSAVLLNEKAGKIVLGVQNGSTIPAIQIISGTFSNLGTVTLSTKPAANATQTIGGNLPMENQGTVSVPAKHSLMLTHGFNDLGGDMTLKGGTILTGDKFNLGGGVFGGIGDVDGPIDNNATVEAGGPTSGPGTGILNLNAPFTQETGGAIRALISGTMAGTQYDQINSTSSMALAGTLNLQFGNGFTPAPTDTFNILNFGSVAGNFSTVNAPTGWTAQLKFTATALNVQFTKNGSVSINPKAAMVKVNGMTQFTGTVAGASRNGKKWSVKESGGGTVTQTGLYAAPATPGTYHVVVSSVADATKSDTATVTVTALRADKLTVTPQAAVLQPGAVLRLRANQAVVWSVAEGRVGGSVTASGSYTAPRQPGLYHVVASSATESSNHVLANIAVTRGELQSAYVANLDQNSVSAFAGDASNGRTSGRLQPTESVATGQRPVGLAISPDGEILLSANEDSKDISVFTISHGGEPLGMFPRTSFAAGAEPSAVAFDHSGRFAFVTNRGSDDVSVFSVDPSGRLTFLSSNALAVGDSPSAIAVNPGGSVVYLTGAGSNTLQGFAYDTAGTLKPITGSPFPTGNSPSALVIDPTGKFLFVANRGSGDVSVFAIDVKHETLREVGGSPFQAGKGADAIVTDVTGTHLFVADHDANDIASFEVDGETGALTALERLPLAAAGPCSLAMDPSGQYLYVTSDRTAGVTTLKVDVASGALTYRANTQGPGKGSAIVLSSSDRGTSRHP